MILPSMSMYQDVKNFFSCKMHDDDACKMMMNIDKYEFFLRFEILNFLKKIFFRKKLQKKVNHATPCAGMFFFGPNFYDP